MSLFDPAATAKSVHDTLDSAMKALPSDARHAVIVDATYDSKGEKRVAGYLVERGPDGWQGVIGGEWDGASIAGKVAVMKVWK